MDDHRGADVYPTACGGPHSRAGACALKEVEACEEPMREQVFWEDLWPHEGPTLEQPVSEGLHPVERNHDRAVLEELVRRTHFGAVHEGLYPV